MKTPKVSVLMPIYNGEKFLRQAIDSILTQTFKDFEFLIIDDGSVDKTAHILKTYKDSRMQIITHKTNKGLIFSLNQGIKIAKGKYIARMDADDISLPDRFIKQVKFMENNPKVAVCGTWIKLINNKNNDIWQPPSDHKTIKSLSLFYSSIYHPTALIRNDTLKRHGLSYNSSFIHAEDYELWVRIMEYAKVVNLKETLLLHRIHPNKVGNIINQIQVESANRVRLYQLHKLGIFPKKHEFAIHQAISYWQFKSDKKFVNDARLWLKKLFIANFNKNYYHQLTFFKVLVKKWFLI